MSRGATTAPSSPRFRSESSSGTVLQQSPDATCLTALQRSPQPTTRLVRRPSRIRLRQASTPFESRPLFLEQLQVCSRVPANLTPELVADECNHLWDLDVAEDVLQELRHPSRSGHQLPS